MIQHKAGKHAEDMNLQFFHTPHLYNIKLVAYLKLINSFQT